MGLAESCYLSLFRCGRHLHLCISTDSSNNRGDHEVNRGKQSCTPIATALLTTSFVCTRRFYFQGDGGFHGGTLPSQWEAGLLVSAHKKSQSAAAAFAQVCGSTAGAGTPGRSDHVTYFAHIKSTSKLAYRSSENKKMGGNIQAVIT